MKHRQILKKILADKLYRQKTIEKMIKDEGHFLRHLDMKKEYRLIQQKKSSLSRQVRNMIVFIIENQKEKESNERSNTSKSDSKL
jgi:hypothetical protein